jgi:putative membrane protein
MKRTFIDYIILGLKGVAMGAADVVPGVSGGTIAFITGIYEELINSIKSINLQSLRFLFKFGIKDFWKVINADFLVVLLTGILISVFSLASLLDYLLTNEPIIIWSFFFGLIVASAILVSKKIEHWGIFTVLFLVIGVVIAYLITDLTPAETTDAWWFIFISGSVAICAMILPGISGSFILLLLGKLQFMYKAISQLDIVSLLIFALGAIVGLLGFSNLLSWLLKKYHNATIAVLTGFMIGSLNKVWPWKLTVSEFVDRHGVTKPLLQENVLPGTYAAKTGDDSQLLFAILLALTGFALIFVFELIAKRIRPKTLNE